MMFSDLHFLRPWWLLLWLFLPVLGWYWRRLGEDAGGWRGLVDAPLLEAQLQRGKRSRIPLAIAMLALALASLALAGPAWREAAQPLQQREAALALVLEVSDSMRATDLKPDRLARARFALTDLLRQRRDGQFALVAYAGAAFTVAPVTDDGATLLALLEALDPSQMPVSGDRAGVALEHAADLLERAGHTQGQILLVADGAPAEAVDAARAIRERGYAVSVLGVGTQAGAPVALPEGGFLKDADGAIVVPALQEDVLTEIAAAGGGRYRTLASGGAEVAALGLFEASGGRYQESDEVRTVFADEGPWLVLLLLPLVALGFRRGWVGCVLLCGLLPAPPVQALDWSALWQRQDQRAWEALQEGEPERAAALARSPQLRGSALYRAGEAEQAARAFAQAEGADAHYNRGNALARAEQYEQALEAYDAALAINPGMEDARANREAVEQWLRQQQSQPQSGQDGQQEQDGEQGESKDDAAEQPGEPGAQQPQPGDAEQKGSESGTKPPGEQAGGDSAGEQQDGDQPPSGGDAGAKEEKSNEQEQQFGEAMQQALEQTDGTKEQDAPVTAADDAATLEQQQAIEQWLRRVPDDPGGLLRRKFLIEYQRRMREGEHE